MEHHHDTQVLGKVAFFSSLAMLILIPLQIVIFAIKQPPQSAELWLALFGQHWFLGLIEMDFLYIIDNSLVALVYLALYHLLKEEKRALMQIALLLGFLGIGAYYSSNPAFELWEVQKQYAAATTAEAQQGWLIIANSLILQWRGTAFNTYYILNGICLIMISYALLKSHYPRKIGMIGLISGLLMSIPSTFGVIGVIFSLLSLIPWMLFLALLLPHFKQMGKA
ncbi:hypothetical protein SDC9_93795 [bioreactor metagenome]|uniref:DUF4386 domain-containing protein n=1 Tax=bioreactor metagenome TaxID=1076179 RepID=A0A645A1Y4_9ZZZZ|nr:hypothetical protein [Sphaerochaeta sp.]